MKKQQWTYGGSHRVQAARGNIVDLRIKARFIIPSVKGETARQMCADKLQRMQSDVLPKEVLNQLGTMLAYAPADTAGCCYCKAPTPGYQGAGRVFMVIPNPPTRGHAHAMAYVVCDACTGADKQAAIRRFNEWFEDNEEDQAELWRKHLELEATLT